MLNDLMLCLALGAALGALATFVLQDGVDELPLSMTIGAAGALIGDGLGLPALGISGPDAQALDSARIAASVVGALLLLAAANLHFRNEAR